MLHYICVDVELDEKIGIKWQKLKQNTRNKTDIIH
jgi:hypothetical protein